MPKPPPSPLPDPTRASGGSCDASVVTDTLGYLIRRVHDQAIRAFYESHGDVDLGPIAYATLAVVARNPGVRQGVVALELGLQESNMASMVKDLMQKRLLLRTRSEEDGRAYGLTLTEGGRRLIGDMLARAGDLDRRQARNLSGEERETLLMLLRKMLRPDEASTDRPGAGTPPPQAS